VPVRRGGGSRRAAAVLAAAGVAVAAGPMLSRAGVDAVVATGGTSGSTACTPGRGSDAGDRPKVSQPIRPQSNAWLTSRATAVRTVRRAVPVAVTDSRTVGLYGT
jgi:hypothetical protein